MFTSVFDSVAGLCCAKDISYTRAWKQHSHTNTHSSQIVQTLDQMHETHNNNNNNDANL